MIKCDIGIAHYDNWTVNCKKKIRYHRMWQIRPKVMLVLSNVIIELSNLRIKNRVSLNVTKVKSDIMLVLHNVIIEPSNLREEKKGTTICDRRIVKCDIGTTQCDNETIKFKKQIKKTIKYDKRTIKCDVETAQCDNGTVKCEKKLRKPPNVRKELSYVILELHIMRMKS